MTNFEAFHLELFIEQKPLFSEECLPAANRQAIRLSFLYIATSCLHNVTQSFLIFLLFSGVRFRRQHWCLLSVFILVLVLCIAIGLPISRDGPPSTPEARMAAVQQLLKEVPLIDG